MREPDFELDGWFLDDGEARQSAAPDTFQIPPLWIREILEPGDLAQLIFGIDVEDDDDPIFFERMWVIVTARVRDGYIGVLDNNPMSLIENDTLWRGTELPFRPKHIIGVRESNAETREIAGKLPRTPWRPLGKA